MLVHLQITTGYNLEDDRCECVALQDYKENEQVNQHTPLLITYFYFFNYSSVLCSAEHEMENIQFNTRMNIEVQKTKSLLV